MNFRFLIILSFYSSLVFSFSNLANTGTTIDSLKNAIKTTDQDSVKVNSYLAWDDLIYISNPLLDLEINKSVEKICLDNLKKSNININEKIFYRKKYAVVCNNLGIYFSDNGDFPNALLYHNKSLKIRQSFGDNFQLGQTYNNLGILYDKMSDYENALNYYYRSLELRKFISDEEGMASTLINIGQIYRSKGEYNVALENFTKSYNLSNKNNNENSKALVQFNRGVTYILLNKLDSAEIYLNESLIINKKNNFKLRIGETLSQLANLNIALGQDNFNKNNLSKSYFNRAIYYANQTLEIGYEINSLSLIMDGAQQQYLSYKYLKNHKEALKAHEIFQNTKDSLNIINNKQLISNQKYQLESKQQSITDSLKIIEEKKISFIKLEKEKGKKNILYGGLLILVIFGLIMYNRFRTTFKQKRIIENQKLIVEEKNIEIMDSIRYAKRIQSAILPPTKLINSFLPNNFVLYKPKDIVAGDFYWIQRFENKILFAAADCTGHGVPGAMVSVVCNNALNRSVKEFNLSQTGKILDKTREIVIEEFEKSDKDVKDGMDISLCALDQNVLEFSGANNAVWIVRNGIIIEYKGDKQPIGKFDFKKEFTTHKILLENNDLLYLFTDGIVDQFGGEKGKKFKPKKLRELLLSVEQFPMDVQKEKIDAEFEKWKSSQEQVDDVCIIGVKINC